MFVVSERGRAKAALRPERREETSVEAVGDQADLPRIQLRWWWCGRVRTESDRAYDGFRHFGVHFLSV